MTARVAPWPALACASTTSLSKCARPSNSCALPEFNALYGATLIPKLPSAVALCVANHNGNSPSKFSVHLPCPGVAAANSSPLLNAQVKVADTCPCNYAASAESNKRWCCGDYPRLDVSQWALETITSETSRWGVFAIKYRTVSCDATIELAMRIWPRCRLAKTLGGLGRVARQVGFHCRQL